MSLTKGKLLYAGKAKSLYETNDDNLLIMENRDDVSAFDGEKKGQLVDKGHVNNHFNAFIMRLLAEYNIPTHFDQLVSPTESVVKRLTMLPVECVVRNRSAGSLCRRLGIEKGTAFNPPVFEFFLKNDDLNDPMVNECHIETFGWANIEQIQEMKRLSLAANAVLTPLFSAADLTLVDYKLEFGIDNGQLVLGDEFTPDGCRIWDKATGESLDKDRFRQGQGETIEYYKLAAQRLGIPL